MKELSNSDKFKALISPKTKDIVAFFDKNGKPAVYARVNIHVLYFYLEIIGSPTTLTTSVQRSHNFGPSSSTNNDIATLKLVIEALCVLQNIICIFCE